MGGNSSMVEQGFVKPRMVVRLHFPPISELMMSKKPQKWGCFCVAIQMFEKL